MIEKPFVKSMTIFFKVNNKAKKSLGAGLSPCYIVGGKRQKLKVRVDSFALEHLLYSSNVGSLCRLAVSVFSQSRAVKPSTGFLLFGDK